MKSLSSIVSIFMLFGLSQLSVAAVNKYETRSKDITLSAGETAISIGGSKYTITGASYNLYQTRFVSFKNGAVKFNEMGTSAGYAQAGSKLTASGTVNSSSGTTLGALPNKTYTIALLRTGLPGDRAAFAYIPEAPTEAACNAIGTKTVKMYDGTGMSTTNGFSTCTDTFDRNKTFSWNSTVGKCGAYDASSYTDYCLELNLPGIGVINSAAVIN